MKLFKVSSGCKMASFLIEFISAMALFYCVAVSAVLMFSQNVERKILPCILVELLIALNFMLYVRRIIQILRGFKKEYLLRSVLWCFISWLMIMFHDDLFSMGGNFPDFENTLAFFGHVFAYAIVISVFLTTVLLTAGYTFAGMLESFEADRDTGKN